MGNDKQVQPDSMNPNMNQQPDILAVLGKLLQSVNQPNQGGNSQGGMSVAGNQLSQWAQNGGTNVPNNVPQSSSPQMSANAAQSISGGPAQNAGSYQKGVQKALQESGYNHATQAIQAGVPQDQIANHPIMTSGQQQGQVNPQAMAVLQQLMSSKTSQQQNQQPQQNTGAYQPTNAVSAFFNSLGITPSAKNQDLNAQAQATRQQVNAGQPASIAEPQARAQQAIAEAGYSGKLAQQIQQQMTQLTPKEQADFQVAMAQGKRETDNQYTQRLDDTIKSQQEYQDILTKSTNFIGRGEKMKTNENLIRTLQNIRAKRVAGATTGGQNSPYSQNNDQYSSITADLAQKELSRRKSAGGQ